MRKGGGPRSELQTHFKRSGRLGVTGKRDSDEVVSDKEGKSRVDGILGGKRENE